MAGAAAAVATAEDQTLASRFLADLYPRVPEGMSLVVWTNPAKRTDWCGSVEEAAMSVASAAGTQNVYVGASLQGKPAALVEWAEREKDEAEREQRTARPAQEVYVRGYSQTARAIGAFWAEVDVKGPGHKEQNLPPTIEDAIDVLQATFPEPTWTVRTGGGVQGWWMLDELWEFADAADRDRAARLMGGFVDTLAAAIRKRGWCADTAVRDLARVMRVPGTFNRKREMPAPALVRAETIDQRYTVADLEGMIKWPEARPVTVPKAWVHRPGDGALCDRDKALVALSKLGMHRCDDYRDWVNVGMALHSVDASQDMRSVWDNWSRASANFQANVCDYKWGTFGRRNGRSVTLGSLIHWAQSDRGERDIFTPQDVKDRRAAARQSPTVVAAAPAADDAPFVEPGTDIPQADDAEAWGDPIPLDNPAVPRLPAGAIRGWLADMVGAVALSTETPLELAAMTGLSVLSAVCQGRFSVLISADYFEPLSSFVGVVMVPGTRKSAVFTRMTAPLRAWEKAKAAAYANIISAAESDRKTMEGKIRTLRAKLEKTDNEQLFGDLKKEVAELEATLPTIPSTPRLFSDDITVEHLGTCMSNNEERLALLSDEGGIFETIGGRYNSQGVGNLDLILKGHSGSPVRVDRGSRPPVRLDHPLLTIGLTIQPDVVIGMAQKPGFRGRGLLGRFWFVVPESGLGYRTHETVPVPQEVGRSYEDAVTRLADVQPRMDGERKLPWVIRLSPGAFALWKAFQREVEPLMRPKGQLEDLSDWGGKLPGAVARLAGLLHCADYASCADSVLEIDPDVMRRAIDLGRFLMGHALAAFGMMGCNEGAEAAKRLWGVIEAKRSRTFSARDAWHPLRGRYKRVTDVEDGFRLLIDHNFIREIHTADRDKPGRPSRRFEVNPAFLVMTT